MVGTMSNAVVGTLTAFTTDSVSVTEVTMNLVYNAWRRHFPKRRQRQYRKRRRSS
jgi:hypothetical protein